MKTRGYEAESRGPTEQVRATRYGLSARDYSDRDTSHRRRYGLPAIAAEIHLGSAISVVNLCYGLPGIAAEIHLGSAISVVNLCYGLPAIAAEIHLGSVISVVNLCYGLPGNALTLRFQICNLRSVKPGKPSSRQSIDRTSPAEPRAM
jgi:hypothetical protein